MMQIDPFSFFAYPNLPHLYCEAPLRTHSMLYMFVKSLCIIVLAALF